MTTDAPHEFHPIANVFPMLQGAEIRCPGR
jgi:hypothetical protein